MKVGRVYNFSAGPAVLPEEVLREAADEMHISREHYSRIENGTRRISLEMLFILMNFYGEDANTILCIKGGKYVEWDV